MAMRIGPGFKRLEERFTDAELLPVVEVAMEEAVAAGLDAAKDKVDSSGDPGATWPNPQPSYWVHSGQKPGPTQERVDTGNMRNALDSRVTISGKGTVRGEVGWIHGSEDYFLYQEYGFDHVIPTKFGYITNKHVEGMHALRDAKLVTEDIFIDRVEREIERLYSS